MRRYDTRVPSGGHANQTRSSLWNMEEGGILRLAGAGVSCRRTLAPSYCRLSGDKAAAPARLPRGALLDDLLDHAAEEVDVSLGFDIVENLASDHQPVGEGDGEQERSSATPASTESPRTARSQVETITRVCVREAR